MNHCRYCEERIVPWWQKLKDVGNFLGCTFAILFIITFIAVGVSDSRPSWYLTAPLWWLK